MQMLLCTVLPNTPHSLRDTQYGVAHRPGGDSPADMLARAVAEGVIRRHVLGQVVVDAALVDVDARFFDEI